MPPLLAGWRQGDRWQQHRQLRRSQQGQQQSTCRCKGRDKQRRNPEEQGRSLPIGQSQARCRSPPPAPATAQVSPQTKAIPAVAPPTHRYEPEHRPHIGPTNSSQAPAASPRSVSAPPTSTAQVQAPPQSRKHRAKPSRLLRQPQHRPPARRRPCRPVSPWWWSRSITDPSRGRPQTSIVVSGLSREDLVSSPPKASRSRPRRRAALPRRSSGAHSTGHVPDPGPASRPGGRCACHNRSRSLLLSR